MTGIYIYAALTTVTFDLLCQVSLNIGAQGNGGNSWNKQYSSLFVVLNEEHEVVSWQLAEKETFDTVKELLTNLKSRLEDQSADVRFFMIDNCCKWRNKIQEVFGKNVVVLLDLFHAIQRITSTMNKRHSLFNDCVKELKFVFRDHRDTGEKRTMNTPDKEILHHNLDRFVEKWSHIASQAGGEYLFRENFLQHVTNLKEHISAGCLSGIPPGYSTSINESLHEKLNDLFAGAKMGPELALALLTIFFYSWNSKRKNKIRGVSIIKPLSSLHAEQAKNEFKEHLKAASMVSRQPNETFGIGVVNNRQQDVNMSSADSAKAEDNPHRDVISQILNAARNKIALAKNISYTPNGIYDVYLLPSVFH